MSSLKWFFVLSALLVLFSAPSFSTPSPEDEDKWLIWSNDVGWIHLGQVREYNKDKPRRLETWGGNSDELLVKTKLFGPFDDKEKALAHLETQVTELEERYNALTRPKNYLVVKVGGAEYKVGDGITLKRVPVVRFSPMYLIHITRTYTTSGPVDKDGYVMHGAEPVDGKFRTADGMGGTFTNEGESKGGPFSTNYELCPVLRGLGHDTIVLPNDRLVDCRDPWWEGQSPTNPADTPDEEDAPEGDGSISVRVLLEDRDDLLTPTDEAYLKIEIKNTSTDKDLSAITARIYLQGGMIESEALWFPRAEKKDFSSALRMIKLAPSQTWEVSEQIKVASERNQWIYDNLIKHTPNDRKPSPEIGVDLNAMVKLVVKGKLSPASGGRGAGEDVNLFDGLVPVVDRNNKVVRLAYPDLSGLAGHPLGPDDMQEYYRRGDAYYSHPGNEFIRAMAFRAARYHDPLDAVMPTSGGLVARGDVDDPGPPFPEGPDMHAIVDRLAHMVHANLFPKQVDKPQVTANDLAQQIWTGKLRPDQDAAGTHFICQEHSYLFGSLLRALGFSVREVNIMVHTTPLTQYQDACTEVYHNHRWNFWGLFNYDGPFNDHYAHYGGYIMSYEMYVGARRATDHIPRFHLSISEMNESPLWIYWGMGNWSGFTQLTDQWASINMVSQWWFGVDSKVQAVIEWFSPVAATVVAPDGRQVGTEEQIDPDDYWNYMVLSGDKPAALVNDIPGALYFPEGYTFYPNAADSESAVTVPQTIVLPVQNPEEIQSYRMVLKGTGEGPYKMKVSFVDGEGKLHGGDPIEGIISTGQRIEHAGEEIEIPDFPEITPDSGLIVDEDGDAPVPAGDGSGHEEKGAGVEDDMESWEVSLAMDKPADALTAWVKSKEPRSGDLADLSELARKAAVPSMKAFVLSGLDSKEKKSEVQSAKEAELAERIQRFLENAVVAEWKTLPGGKPAFKFWVPMGDIRMLLEHYK